MAMNETLVARPALAAVGRAAVRALYLELVLEPKPGLVSLRDTGSHADMDAATFMRSLFALRGYFLRVAEAGACGAPFATLERLGREAEARMLCATGGINTHRGAVFCLGLLCASAGALLSAGGRLQPAALRTQLALTWGDALRERARRHRGATPRSHGQRAAQRHGLRSAGDEAAAGFPTLFDVTLPALAGARATGAADRAARVQALFATMAVLDDTNLVHRAGIDGLRDAQRAARDFLGAGGVFRADWVAHARSIHAHFVGRRLSPGGSADLLGGACWTEAVAGAPR
jgi:triphosphoribosyl-dephospho-CoA synthase